MQYPAELLNPSELEESLSTDSGDRAERDWHLIELAAEKWLVGEGVSLAATADREAWLTFRSIVERESASPKDTVGRRLVSSTVFQEADWEVAAELVDTAIGTVQKRFAAILERERTAVADGVNAIKKAIASRRWLYDGERGSYAYDDDRFYAEFKAAIDEIEAATEPLRVIARDWSDCRETTIEVQMARAPAAIAAVKGEANARIAALEGALKPFACACEGWCDAQGIPDDCRDFPRIPGEDEKIANCLRRRARAVLADSTPEPARDRSPV